MNGWFCDDYIIIDSLYLSINEIATSTFSSHGTHGQYHILG